MSDPLPGPQAPSRSPGTLGRIHRLIRSNWITSLGAATMTLAVLLFVTIYVLQSTGSWGGPYIGIAWLALPALFVAGLLMVPFGLLVYRRRLRERLAAMTDKPSSLARAVVVITAINFAAVGTVGYSGVHYMSSTEFCGTACHDAMAPEYVTYQSSPHARVECVACHVGPGATWFVKSKLNGAKQLLGYLTDSYHKPIPTPVNELRTARETCENCHWSEKYLGTKLVVLPHYREDEAVSGFTNVLLMRTGGTRPDGESVGIHWHVHPEAVVEYVATDERREQIPWVRVVKPDGTHDVYVAEGYSHDEPPPGELRQMDCNDCHNRSAHRFELPDEALDRALAAGLISRQLPAIKKYAIEALRTEWTREGAADGIRRMLQKAYAERGQLDETNRRRLEQAIAVVTDIWLRNIWPERKVFWNTYPDLDSHQGCYRCHDDKHLDPEGRAIRQDCDICHVVLSQEEEDPRILDSLGLRRRD